MSSFNNPFDPETPLHRQGCACGQHQSQEQHDAEVAELQRQRQSQLQTVAASEEARYGRAVEGAVVRALFRATARGGASCTQSAPARPSPRSSSSSR